MIQNRYHISAIMVTIKGWTFTGYMMDGKNHERR